MGHFGTADATEKIELFEKAFGVKLPYSHKVFLRNFDGGFIADSEAESMIQSGEFEEAKFSRTRFLSIDEIINEYETMDLDDWNRPSWFEGFYPYIPIGITDENEKLVFVDNFFLEEESCVFLALHDTPAYDWMVAADSFTEFLEDFYNTGGKPDVFKNDAAVNPEDFLEKLNERKAEKENPKAIIQRSTAYLSLFPDSAITFNERANAYRDAHQYEKALADYAKSLELDPQLALAYYCRGSMLLSLQKARQALIDLDSACQLDANDELYLTRRADAFFALGKLDKALADCNHVLEMNPRYFSALSTRRRVYSALGETEKAKADESLIDELLAEDD
jgi:tetratricopeptide (TPR) repeat protein